MGGAACRAVALHRSICRHNGSSRNLVNHKNVEFHQASLDASGLLFNSQDFGYSLGVLHHVPDTVAAVHSCTALLKPGAPLLLYLYYAFDGRPWWFRTLWRLSDLGRRVVFRLSPRLKHTVTDMIATLVYWPLARLSLVLSRLGLSVDNMPLSYYRHHSFYTMRTDARDRFGTPLEQRFTRKQIAEMMTGAGLEKLNFSDSAPYWCVVGFKKVGSSRSRQVEIAALGGRGGLQKRQSSQFFIGFHSCAVFPDGDATRRKIDTIAQCIFPPLDCVRTPV